MADPTIFSIDYTVFRRRFQHECILSKGKDKYLEYPCLNHLVTNKLDGSKHVLQIFSSMPNEIFAKKLDHISKAAYNYFIPTTTRIIAHATRKNEDRSHDLFILYDFNENEMSLEEQIRKQKEQNKPFAENELYEVLYTLLDSTFMCGRLSNEFIDISPHNVFYHSKDEHYKYRISNLSASLPKKLEKKFFSPSDRFYTAKLTEKNSDMLCRALLFQIGMIILYMATLEEPNDLYTESNNIKEDLLAKRLESLKNNKGFSEKLHQILSLILVTKEEKRISLEDLLKVDKGDMLPRDHFYYQGKLETAQNYSGFAKFKSKDNKDKSTLIPHGFGDILFFNGDTYKGNFKEGKRDGWGIWFNGTNIFINALWDNDNSKQGQLIVKNVGMHFMNSTAPKSKGKGSWIPLTSNMISPILYYDGEFNESGEKINGDLVYKDGSKYIGELKNDIRNGKGLFIFPAAGKDKTKQYEGYWVDDKMHGEGKLVEGNKIWEVKYDKGNEISRKDWGVDMNTLKEKAKGGDKKKDENDDSEKNKGDKKKEDNDDKSPEKKEKNPKGKDEKEGEDEKKPKKN